VPGDTCGRQRRTDPCFVSWRLQLRAMYNGPTSLAIAIASAGGGMLLPRPSNPWRSFLRYATAAVDDSRDSRAVEVPPQAQRQRIADLDYYEAADITEDPNSLLDAWGQQLVPAHLVVAAFSAGWVARGHASLARRILAAIAEVALRPAHAARGRRQNSSAGQPPAEQDLASLVAELRSGGEAARQAAAQQLAAATSKPANGPRSKKGVSK
jgi:hypothetical protein